MMRPVMIGAVAAVVAVSIGAIACSSERSQRTAPAYTPTAAEVEAEKAGTLSALAPANLANVVDDAVASRLRPLVVGPPPWLDPEVNERLEVVVDAQRDVCERRGVIYVDCFTPLRSHEQWYADLGVGDGIHPGQAGYGLLAWLVLHSGWSPWLGLEPA